MAVQRDDVMCEVSSIAYDFDKRSGKLVMAEDQCADMAGCIRLFKAIDPDVQLIKTLAGTKPDTIYKLLSTGEWAAALTR